MDLYSNIAKHTMNLGTLVTQTKFEQSDETRQSLGFFHWLYFVGWCFAYIYGCAPHVTTCAPMKPEEGTGFSQTGVSRACEPL